MTEQTNTTRTSATQLPSPGELESMVMLECERTPIESKRNLHYVDYKTCIRWLEILGIYSTSLFTDEVDSARVLEFGTSVTPQLVAKTLEGLARNDSELIKVLDGVTTYLGEEDDKANADLILVFGSADQSRIEKGVELWKLGLAPILAITGGQPYYQTAQIPEAVTFARRAIEMGVPKDRIILEPNSFNLPDNVKTILNLLDNLEVGYQTGIICVSAWFSLRRVWAHLMKLSPDGTKIYRASPNLDSGKLMKTRWYDNEFGIRIVFNEYIKMRTAELYNNLI